VVFSRFLGFLHHDCHDITEILNPPPRTGGAELYLPPLVPLVGAPVINTTNLSKK
jgi:hypothetical protein